MAGILSLLVSHFIYLYESTSQNLSIVHTKDYILVSVFWFIVIDRALWCILSSKKNYFLYFRLGIITTVLSLGHRLFFGLDSAGSWYFNLVYCVFATPFVLYALIGEIPKNLVEVVMNRTNQKECSNVVEARFNAK
jgi:hypothetical protein